MSPCRLLVALLVLLLLCNEINSSRNDNFAAAAAAAAKADDNFKQKFVALARNNSAFGSGGSCVWFWESSCSSLCSSSLEQSRATEPAEQNTTKQNHTKPNRTKLKRFERDETRPNSTENCTKMKGKGAQKHSYKQAAG